MRAALSQTQASSGCSGTYTSTTGGTENGHYHLHLHNYLSAHSTQVGMSSRMVAVDRAIETMLPQPTFDQDASLDLNPFTVGLPVQDDAVTQQAAAQAKVAFPAPKAQFRLFDDPLAYVLAGAEMVEKSVARRADLQRKIEAQIKAMQSGTQLTASESTGRPTGRPASSAATGRPAAAGGSTDSTATAGPRRLTPEMDPAATPRVAIRTRYFDDLLTAAHAGKLVLPLSVQPDSSTLTILQQQTRDALQSLTRLSVRQFVLVQSGMDTRAYRLPFIRQSTLTKVYELDQAPILQYKNGVIASVNGNYWNTHLKCQRVCVACDLTGTSNGSAHMHAVELSKLVGEHAMSSQFGEKPFHYHTGAGNNNQSSVQAAQSHAAALNRVENRDIDSRMSNMSMESSGSTPNEIDTPAPHSHIVRTQSLAASVTDFETSPGSLSNSDNDYSQRSRSDAGFDSSTTRPGSGNSNNSDSSTSPPRPSASARVALLPWSAAMVLKHDFDATQPSFWLLEGNLMYMTESQSIRVIDECSLLAAPGSLLAFSHINERALANVQRSGQAWGLVSNTWNSCMTPKLMQRLTAAGWSLIRMTRLGAADANYNRWHGPVFAMDDPDRGITIYATYVKTRRTQPARSSLLMVDTSYQRPTDRHSQATVGSIAPQQHHHQLRQHSAASTSSDESPLNDQSDSDRPQSRNSFSNESGNDAPTSGTNASLDMSPADDDSTDSPTDAASMDSERRRRFADLAAADRRAREFVIDSWNDRAEAYSKLLTDYDMFTRFAQRLIDLLPLEQESIRQNNATMAQFTPIKIVDLGAGTGCVSVSLLHRFPLAQVHIVEPSLHMLTAARRSIQALQAKADSRQSDAILSCDMIRGEDCAILAREASFEPVQGVLCSTAMHLMNENQILPQVHALLEDGGVFCYNLLSHSFDVTRASHQANEAAWKRAVNAALLQCGEITLYDLSAPASAASDTDDKQVGKAPAESAGASASNDSKPAAVDSSLPPASPMSATSPVDVCIDSIRSVASLQQCAAVNGFALDALQVDTDLVTVDLFVAFNAMNPQWLHQYKDKRQRIIDTARSLARQQPPVEMQTVRVRMMKLRQPNRNKNANGAPIGKQSAGIHCSSVS